MALNAFGREHAAGLNDPAKHGTDPAPRLDRRAAVRLEAVTVRFEARLAPVLSGLDLDLHQGEFLCLLGPSGCGKSTVLRLMAGLLQAQGGRIETTAQAPAFVFQDPTLMPWASLADNVALPLKLARTAGPLVASRVAEVLARVGLSGREQALPHELSGGMRMRASIARALVMQPDLLLMDEPFAALDDVTRRRLQDDLLQWWRSEGFSVCFVTHQVAEAVFMSERVAVFEPTGGRIRCSFVIDEPYPRGEAFRRSARFHDWCAQIGEAMAGEVAP